MKKLFYGLTTILLSSILNAQNPSWISGANYIQDVQNPAQIYPLPQPAFLYGTSIPDIGDEGNSYQGQLSTNASNMMTDANGEILFFIVDEHIYNKDGYCLGILSKTQDPFEANESFHIRGASEIAIIPNPVNCQQYYIISTFVEPGILSKKPWVFLLDLCVPNETAEIFGVIEPVFGSLVPIGSYSGNSQTYGLNIENVAHGFSNESDPSPGKESNVFIASPDKNINNERLVFISNGFGIYKFKIDANGFSFASSVIPFDISILDYNPNLIRAEMEVIRLANGNFRIACPYFKAANIGGNLAWEFLYVAELDANGDLIATSIQNFPFYKDPASITGYTDVALKGVEFSQDGNILYVTHTTLAGIQPDQIEYFDFSNPTLDLVPLLISTLVDAQFSMLEIDAQGSIYFNGSTGMFKIPNANTPNTSIIQVLNSPGNFNYENNGVLGFYSDLWKLYPLPDQIDDMDYIEIFNTPQCCLETKSYDKLNYTAQSGGIWRDNVFGPGSNPLINGTGSSADIRGELRIPEGIVLTIRDMTLRFAPGARLVIENGNNGAQGGKLILDNTILTVDDDCDPGNLMWLGVEVWGNQNLNQGDFNSSTQGRFEMKNNAVIEHAFIGTLVSKREGIISGDYSCMFSSTVQPFIFNDNFNGGIVRVIDSEYRQNQRGIWMRKYLNPNGNNNVSFVNNSKFDWISPLNGDIVLNSHIILEYVKGINIRGTEFKNSTTLGNPQFDLGIGIISRYSQFNVTTFCPVLLPSPASCPNPVRCKFTNLSFGIHATNSTDNLTFSVEKSDFTNCTAGIHTIGTKNERITKNFFFVREANYNTVGISLFNSTGYVVQENILLGDPTQTGQASSYGIVVENSGIAPNLIYKNTFRDLMIGGYSIKENGSSVNISNFPNYQSSTGLKWKCNSFSSPISMFDLAVNGKIDYNQGYLNALNLNNARNSAISNNFSLNYDEELTLVPQAFNHDIFLADGSQPIRYVHLADINQIPDFYSNTVAPIQSVFLGIPINSLYKTCASKLDKPIIIVKNDLENAIAQRGIHLEKLIAGSSTLLLELINNGTNPQAIKDELLSKSPFLSNEILIAYVNSSASSGMKKEVLLANSHLSTDVMVSVMNSNLPVGTKNQIISAQNGVSQKDDVLSDIDHLTSEIDQNYSEILSRLLMDSTALNGYSAAIEFLNEINDVKSKKVLIDIYLSINDFENMNLKKSELLAATNEPDYFTLQDIKEQLRPEPSIEHALEIISGLESQLENLAFTSTNIQVKAQSKSLLEFRDGYSPLPNFLPLFNSAMILSDAEESDHQEFTIQQIVSIYPNPSNGLVFFDYPDLGEGILSLQLLDLNGKEVYSYSDSSVSNGELIDLNLLKKGLYMVKVYLDGNYIETQKLLLK